MVSGTSKEVYKKILESGLLREKQKMVYKVISDCRNGITMTSTLDCLGYKTNQSGRFSELVKMGVIEVIRKEKCFETGNTVGVYAVTGKMPIQVKRTKKPTDGLKKVWLDPNTGKMYDIVTMNEIKIK